jgi:hypothetical protein
LADLEPQLPRVPEDLDALRRLRREALRRLEEEEHGSPVVVYGGPPVDPSQDGPLQPERLPAAVYGGPPLGGGSVSRRWTLKHILILIGTVLAALSALFFGARKLSAPVYGGPPLPPQPRPAPVVEPYQEPAPSRDNQPVYGGPKPYEPEPRPTPNSSHPNASNPDASNPDASNPDASNPDASNPGASYPNAVYGGPPPTAPEPPQ